jgi:macrodomain Ter protein organizer (MatP/YcbG family)
MKLQDLFKKKKFNLISSHKGENIGRMLENTLIEWEIESMFTITADNVIVNDVAIDYMRRKLKNKRDSIMGGEFLHMRCAAHILNCRSEVTPTLGINSFYLTCNRLTVTYMTYYIKNAMQQLLYIEKDNRDNRDRKMSLGKTYDSMCFNLFGFLNTWKALRPWILWVLL